VLLVEGQSGMGKSQLLVETIEVAASRGFMLARGAADEAGRLAPLKPLMSAFGESAQTLWASHGAAASGMVDVRLWLVEQLQARLEERAAHGPHLVTLDDLQWADPTTLLALRTLIPELASYPLVWILARTNGFGDSGVERLYEFLEREGAARVTLEALSDTAVAEIITDVLGAAPEPELLAMAAGAGGNPFILIEFLEGLRDEGAIEVRDGRARMVSRRLPHRMQEMARTRLGRLSAETRHLLEVAAILGRSFDVNDLAEMLGEPVGRLLPALEEAQTTEVVVPAEDTLMFRHDLLWRAVTATLTGPVREALHRQAAELLLRRGGSAIPAAAHLMRYIRPGDASALAGLDKAVAEVLPSSPHTAADIALRALELTEPIDPARFDRTVTAVYALTTGGRLIEATELGQAELERAMPPSQAARLRYELAYALLLGGHPVKAVAEAEEALRQEGVSEELRGLLEQVLFRGMLATHERTRGREQAKAALESPWQSARLGAHMLLSSVAWSDGRADRGLEHLREAVRIMAADPDEAGRAHPRIFLADLLIDLRRFDEAESHFQTCTEEISALGHMAYAASPAIFRSRLRLAEGRLDDAVVEAEAGLTVADEMGMRAFVLVAITVLAIVAVRRGAVDAAAGHVKNYESQHQDGEGPTYGMAWGNWGLALAADARNDRQKAIDILRAPYTDPSERRWLLMSEPDAAAWMTRTALAVADRAGAETVAVTAGHLANDNPGFPTLAASAAQARGILDGDAEALARAAGTHVGPWSRASAAEDLGVLLTRTGDAAIDRLDQALDGYERIGASRDAARVRARLRGLGVRRRHWTALERPASGWVSLTDTERDVALLVAQGRTNPQVAAQMFVSPHTVKFHLRQVFRKLGIASRVELARLAAEHAPDG
jgi:DNA-binding CsgD family transcriptional regulator/tetratricopeptide (TPR) repeat protein